MNLRLIGDDGPLAGACLELGEGEHRLGAGGAVDLSGDPLADGLAATLLVTAAGVTLRDDDSRQGVFLNGHRILAAPLHAGDVVQLGRSRFRVELPAGAGLLCPGCGEGLGAPPPAVCPRCGRDLRAVVAGVASSPERRYCVACGRPAPPGARFCPACGRDQEQSADARPGLPVWVAPVLALLVALLFFALLGLGLAIGLVRQTAGLATNRDQPVAAALPQPPVDRPPEPTAEAPPEAAEVTDWQRAGRLHLRYGGRVGETYRYTSASRVEGSMRLLGQTLPLQVATSSGYTQEVLEASGDRLRLRLTLLPSRVEQNGAPFGGALPPPPAPVTVTLDPTGRIAAVDQPAGGEVAPVPGLPGGVTFDYRAITQSFSAAAFPEQAVAVGETWRRDFTTPLPGGGSIRFQSTSRLDGFETVAGVPCARIVSQLTAPLTMNLTDPRDNAPVSQVGQLTGTITTWFNPTEGVLERSASDLALTMTMKLAEGEQNPLAALGQASGLSGAAGELALEATGQVRQTVERER